MRTPFLLLPLALLAGCDLQSSKDLTGCIEGVGGAKTQVAVCTRAIADGGDAEKIAQAYHKRGEAYQELDNDAAALADYGRALAKQPELVDALQSRGWLLIKLERSTEALADFTKAVRVAPDDGYAQFGEVVALEKLDRYAPALAKVERALFLFTDDASASANALGERCWIRAVLGVELDAALVDCDANLADDEEDYSVMNSRGLVNYRLGNHAEAIEDYSNAIEGDADEASNFYVRGLARHALGEVDAGYEDVARALELDPGVAREYAGYGVAGLPPRAEATALRADDDNVKQIEP